MSNLKSVARACVRARPIPRTIRSRPGGLYFVIFKNLVDRAAAALILAAALIPMVVIAVVIAATLGRPIFFRQERVGLDGQRFEVLKFRTMKPDRRKVSIPVAVDRRKQHKSADDPRITRFGRFLRKWSLDELPQLINVLAGQMSLVGPRPELPHIVEEYPPEMERRHLVKPGLTGYWQIRARADGPMHENGHYDLEYVDDVSLLTDLKILAQTPMAIVGPQKGY